MTCPLLILDALGWKRTCCGAVSTIQEFGWSHWCGCPVLHGEQCYLDFGEFGAWRAAAYPRAFDTVVIQTPSIESLRAVGWSP